MEEGGREGEEAKMQFKEKKKVFIMSCSCQDNKECLLIKTAMHFVSLLR